jgi:hypothetical protein
MIVIDHFNEWLDFITTSLFLLSHAFGYLAWITSDASDDSMTVATFIATFIVRLIKNKIDRREIDELRNMNTYFNNDSLAASIATGEDNHYFLTFHYFHHDCNDERI